jgi:AcrR family transcriptional regulator
MARVDVGRIARAAGVARGSFYFHFPTKEHVLLDLLLDIEARLAERARQVRGGRGAIDRTLAVLADELARVEAEFGTNLTRDMVVTFLNPPEAEGVYDPANHPLFAAVLERVTSGQTGGHVRDDLDPVDITSELLAGFFGSVLVQTLLRGEHARRPTQLDTMRTIVTKGLDPR